jgi:hypothetical protein
MCEGHVIVLLVTGMSSVDYECLVWIMNFLLILAS